MSRIFNHALVVGKFSPLHRGHELLIRKAMELSREMTVISYARPEYAGCDAKQREQWLTAVFPKLRSLVIDDSRLAAMMPGRSVTLPHDNEPELVHRRFVGLLCHDLLGITVDAVFTSEDYGDGFAAELTSFFREHDPAVQQVTHVLVDRERLTVPVSGTLIRSDIHGYRDWLSPAVYSSFVKRICILGGESTGKTTLAGALAEYYKTEMVYEFGRELWEEKGGALEFDDMRIIAERQVEMEERALLKANRYLFCDTSPLTTLLYTRYLFDRSEELLERLAGRQYFMYILCTPDIPFVQDGTRQERGFREYQHSWYMKELDQRGIPYLSLGGVLSARVAIVASLLDKSSEEL